MNLDEGGVQSPHAERHVGNRQPQDDRPQRAPHRRNVDDDKKPQERDAENDAGIGMGPKRQGVEQSFPF